MGFFSRAFLVFLMKESKNRGRKQPGKLMAKSRSQPVNLPGAQPPDLQFFSSLIRFSLFAKAVTGRKYVCSSKVIINSLLLMF